MIKAVKLVELAQKSSVGQWVAWGESKNFSVE
jgi:hypothetical protein